MDMIIISFLVAVDIFFIILNLIYVASDEAKIDFRYKYVMKKCKKPEIVLNDAKNLFFIDEANLRYGVSKNRKLYNLKDIEMICKEDGCIKIYHKDGITPKLVTVGYDDEYTHTPLSEENATMIINAVEKHLNKISVSLVVD